MLLDDASCFGCYNKDDNFMIKSRQSMNDYKTPRRRHSSLFQRMEDQIHKISKKLSAAKQHRQTHTHTHSRKHTVAYPMPSFQPHLDDTPEETVRRSNNSLFSSQELTKKGRGLAEPNKYEQSTRAPVRRLRFGLDQSERHPLKSLVDENKALESQVRLLKTICQEQAFKVGYIRAESRQRQNEHELQKNSHRREQVYLTKLAEGFQLKIQKYKKIMGEEDSLELSINDL